MNLLKDGGRYMDMSAFVMFGICKIFKENLDTLSITFGIDRDGQNISIRGVDIEDSDYKGSVIRMEVNGSDVSEFSYSIDGDTGLVDIYIEGIIYRFRELLSIPCRVKLHLRSDSVKFIQLNDDLVVSFDAHNTTIKLPDSDAPRTVSDVSKELGKIDDVQQIIDIDHEFDQ